MIRRPPRSTPLYSSAASDVYKRQVIGDIEFISNDRVVLSAPLVAIESVEAKGFFGRIWARIVFWILSLFSIDQND